MCHKWAGFLWIYKWIVTSQDRFMFCAFGFPYGQISLGERKKSSPISLNHLLNFTLAPRERGGGGDYPVEGYARGRHRRISYYNKEQFLQAKWVYLCYMYIMCNVCAILKYCEFFICFLFFSFPLIFCPSFSLPLSFFLSLPFSLSLSFPFFSLVVNSLSGMDWLIILSIFMILTYLLNGKQ